VSLVRTVLYVYLNNGFVATGNEVILLRPLHNVNIKYDLNLLKLFEDMVITRIFELRGMK
jgi:hypothetical protein